MQVMDFIKQHNHIRYCEAIILPNGDIEYANPSHTYKLCEIYDSSKSIKEINSIIPLQCSPIDWLCRECQCVAVWYNMIMYDYKFQKITEQQKDSIKALIDNKVIDIPYGLVNELEQYYESYQEYLYKLPEKDRILILKNEGVIK